MKKIILGLLLIISMASCTKNFTDCYQCNFDGAGYKDMGCYTKAQWDGITFTDALGNVPYSKSLCRKK